jgi:hypothetical protein
MMTTGNACRTLGTQPNRRCAHQAPANAQEGLSSNIIGIAALEAILARDGKSAQRAAGGSDFACREDTFEMSPVPSPRKLGLLQVILLAIPCIAVLIVPFFNRLEPSLFGVPFFYWWQIIWVPLSSVFIAVVYKMTVPPGSGD